LPKPSEGMDASPLDVVSPLIARDSCPSFAQDLFKLDQVDSSRTPLAELQLEPSELGQHVGLNDLDMTVHSASPCTQLVDQSFHASSPCMLESSLETLHTGLVSASCTLEAFENEEHPSSLQARSRAVWMQTPEVEKTSDISFAEVHKTLHDLSSLSSAPSTEVRQTSVPDTGNRKAAAGSSRTVESLEVSSEETGSPASCRLKILELQRDIGYSKILEVSIEDVAIAEASKAASRPDTPSRHTIDILSRCRFEETAEPPPAPATELAERQVGEAVPVSTGVEPRAVDHVEPRADPLSSSAAVKAVEFLASEVNEALGADENLHGETADLARTCRENAKRVVELSQAMRRGRASAKTTNAGDGDWLAINEEYEAIMNRWGSLMPILSAPSPNR